MGGDMEITEDIESLCGLKEKYSWLVQWHFTIWGGSLYMLIHIGINIRYYWMICSEMNRNDLKVYSFNSVPEFFLWNEDLEYWENAKIENGTITNVF